MANTKPQEFNPDNVLMHEHKEGELLNDFNEPILLDILENSKIMQLGQIQDMGGKSEKKFTYWADRPGAYWVGEGQKIQTSKPSIVEASMRSHKLGVIVVASREYLNYTYARFFEAMKPQIAEQFYKKFDEAGILGVDNPFAQSISDSATKSDNVVTGPINLENVLALEDALLEHDVEANGFISKTQNRTALRGVVDEDTKERYYDRANNTLDSIPVVDLKSDGIKKGDLYAGDFNKLFYGIPYNLSYKISEEGQLSTVTNADGSPVNLFEQELIALRVTMDVAFHVAQDEAFAKLEAGSGETV
ncbi:phage major capsid protein [Staphylococcus saprophyticus]|uniref:phage major capsid protein n=3 Tax=Staphylococcus saprophyticus TaxID=29385 RepID=UPI00157E1B42|nr:phage major capsid protein [Staphylococcus saprophyticus]MDW4148539.1 phage major capsid protein [Staphylococcus saprophyticus]MDW4377881.1 phage major capsid protein [Staphylococcus saprophyticus]QKQ32212.1 phage major capsid protein [Staphylococcus saprophyticus]